MTETKKASDPAAKREQRLTGVVVSRGTGIGKIVLLHGEKKQFVRLNLDAGQIESEIRRFKTALDTSIRQLQELSKADHGRPVSDILDVHILILESAFVEKIEAVINNECVNAEWAIQSVSDQHIKQQQNVEDIQFADKRFDIEDVRNRLINALDESHADAQLDPGSVIVARYLSPSSIIDAARDNPAAIITEQGGWTSHSAILAREFNIPMVSGVRDLRHSVTDGDLVILDGVNGVVILHPSEKTVSEFETADSDKKSSVPKTARENLDIANSDSFVIRANADQSETYETAKRLGANGIGLYRSELLIRPPGKVPTEDQQYDAYCRIADAAGEHGVRIRTFDVGVARFGSDPHWIERNPALGLRAIRLSLADPTHFRVQIRAIWRAAVGRKIDIILPMISAIDEIVRSKAIIDEERDALIKAGIDIGDPEIGAMIETPSAVLTAYEIAKQVDFLCLGTNDLVQYLLAVDRDNDDVAEWYQTLHPAVIRAIGEVLVSAEKANVPIAVCGEMAGSPFYVPVLLGLGAREFSMNVNSISQVLQLLSGISVDAAVYLVENIKKLSTAEEIETYLREYYLKDWANLFPPDFLNSRFR